MFLELIATFVAGFGAAGAVLLLNRLVKGRLPRWLMPVAAGAAMIFTTISSEYGWYGRTKADLPEGLIIAQTVENRTAYRPWTLINPYIDRFVAVDAQSLKTHTDHPDKRLIDLYFFGRWSPINRLASLVDCTTHQRASLSDGVQLSDAGAFLNLSWVSANADDPIIQTTCGL